MDSLYIRFDQDFCIKILAGHKTCEIFSKIDEQLQLSMFNKQTTVVVSFTRFSYTHFIFPNPNVQTRLLLN